MLTSYPQANEALIDDQAEAEMQAVIELVSRVRNIRSEIGVKPSQEIPIIVKTSDERTLEIFDRNSAQIGRLTRTLMTRATSVYSTVEIPRASARAVLAGGAEVAVPLEGLIDFAQERERLAREREKLQKEAAKLEAQLANPQFAERAPVEKVNETKERLADIARRTAALQQMAEALR
jgi:valyl-tRNA synthetase